jgi:hypothetical protein
VDSNYHSDYLVILRDIIQEGDGRVPPTVTEIQEGDGRVPPTVTEIQEGDGRVPPTLT